VVAFKQPAGVPDKLAAKLHEPEACLIRLLETLEGKDPHDWVNDLCDEYGRQRVLGALTDLWCEENPEIVREFGDELETLGVA